MEEEQVKTNLLSATKREKCDKTFGASFLMILYFKCSAKSRIQSHNNVEFMKKNYQLRCPLAIVSFGDGVASKD
jgi:hypothetical protein